mmetsp:Transcript_13571/g.49348  ORF Transcript_13571/g.49348 Transcript_13571/m.49348 type:complete len:436 (+) Transcript_13571:231-1538(+)
MRRSPRQSQYPLRDGQHSMLRFVFVSIGTLLGILITANVFVALTKAAPGVAIYPSNSFLISIITKVNEVVSSAAGAASFSFGGAEDRERVKDLPTRHFNTKKKIVWNVLDPAGTDTDPSSPKQLCSLSTAATGNAVRLFIGVSSGPADTERRGSIRRTWMRSIPRSSSTLCAKFFVEMHPSEPYINALLAQEAREHGDIVLLPEHHVRPKDIPALKIIKILERGLDCGADYIMKTDDSTFVFINDVWLHISDMHQRLGDAQEQARADGNQTELSPVAVYAGQFIPPPPGLHRPERDPDKPMYLSEVDYPESELPPFARGSALVVSGSLASVLVDRYRMHMLRRHVPFDDMTLGMWIEQIKTVENVRIHYEATGVFNHLGCAEQSITAGKQSMQQMLCMWDKLGDHELKQLYLADPAGARKLLEEADEVSRCCAEL